MAWHDAAPWRGRNKAELVTVTEKLADVERRVRGGDLGIHQALLQAYQIGEESGRANPVGQRIGEAHQPEIQS
ncbi:MAG: hypothetical protein KGR24_07950 [Planctomycetes bacterium]|nr:hypothetical protein [Planctomycetota bacterium]